MVVHGYSWSTIKYNAVHGHSWSPFRRGKGGKCKISRVLQSPVSSTQASPKVEASIDLSRLNNFLLVERFKMETPESIRASLIPGEWVSPIDLSDAYLHIPINQNSKEVPRKVLPQVASVSAHFPSLRTSHSPSGLNNDCKRG